VDSGGSAQVEERYVLTPGPAALELRALSRRCAELLNLRVERRGTDVLGVHGSDGPWLSFRDTATAPGGDTLRLVVRYEVRRRDRSADVPLWHLTTPIPQRDGEREGTVSLLVRFADGDGRLAFPHATRDATGAWSGRYVAIPSFVSVSHDADVAGAPSDCDPSALPPGDDGGLVWRFFLLIGIMVAWVPLYLAWARRSVEGDA